MIILYDTFLSIILFGLGSALASFYIAQMYRIEARIGFPEIVNRGSFCEKCERELKWYDLIPVVSYILTGGRCRNCEYKISITYPVFEFLLGTSTVMLFLYHVDLPYFILLHFLAFLALYDYYYKGFPKALMHSFLAISAVVSLYNFFNLYDRDPLVYVVALAVVLSIIILNILKKSFGTGDLLVILMVSMYLTLKEFLGVMLFSVVLAGLFSIVWVLLKKANRKDTIPFVPFIFLAYLLIFPLNSQLNDYFTYFLFVW